MIHHKSLNRSAILYLRGLKNFISYDQMCLVGAIIIPNNSVILNESAPRNLPDALVAILLGNLPAKSARRISGRNLNEYEDT